MAVNNKEVISGSSLKPRSSSKFSIDLSLLEKTSVTDGHPMDLPLTDVEENPDSPRRIFYTKAMEELTKSVKIHGVLSPICVKTHPNKAGKWRINSGARRFRAAMAVGNTTIPAYVDETYDDWDFIIENELQSRYSLKEIAGFMQSKLDEGVKIAALAREMVKSKAEIRAHLSLIDAPKCIDQVYRDGRNLSSVELCQLRVVYDRYPAEVSEWCDDGCAAITRKSIEDLWHKLNRLSQ